MGTELPRYVFEALHGPEDMRVLEVLGTTSRIECKLRRTKISESSYQAISYVWGSEKKPFKAVICDEEGKAIGWLALTASLQDVLRSLQDCSELKSKVFWIDQICIDQEDNDEKSHQVGFMGEIYKNASRVIVYIGPTEEPEEERAGIELIQKIGKTFQESCNLLYSYTNLTRAMQNRKRLIPVSGIPAELQDDETLTPEQQEDRYVNQGWRWLCSVAYGEWNRRLWMVQEQLLNRETTMLRGSCLLSWDHIAAIPILFQLRLLPWSYCDQFWLKSRADARYIPNDVADAVFYLWWARKEWDIMCSEEMLSTYSPGRQILIANLGFYQDLECRDPRDRIYALLAISEDTQRLGISPDYSQDFKSISIKTSIAILRQLQNLTLLTFACRWANSDTTFPSWAVNLLRHPSPLNLPFNMLAAHPKSSKQYAPRFASNNTVLVVRGRVLDRLSTHAFPIFYTSSFTNSFFDTAWLHTAIRILESWSSILLHRGVIAEDTARLCCAIMARKADWACATRDPYSPEEEMVFCFWSIYRELFYEALYVASKSNAKIENRHRLESTFSQLTILLSGRVDTDTIKPTDPLTDEECQMKHDFSVFQLVHGRSFSFTQQGRVCNAMHEVQPGDAVAAFQGADRLYIIRPVGDKFRLVGDAYIPGLMFGEAYEGLDPDTVDYDIELI